MTKDIVKDINVLHQKSEQFVFGEDDAVILDLLDTANAHASNCAGLAAIQIGVAKRAIVIKSGKRFVPFINPVIIICDPKTYVATEGCLSLSNTYAVKRYYAVMVRYQNVNGSVRTRKFSGRTAQILQHEIDHLNGITIQECSYNGCQ